MMTDAILLTLSTVLFIALGYMLRMFHEWLLISHQIRDKYLADIDQQDISNGKGFVVPND